jgi:5'-nucleotidase
MKKVIAYCVLVTLLLFALAAAGPATVAAKPTYPEVDFYLTILHNNDGESQVINAGSGLEDFGGAARFKAVVDKLKWEATHGPWTQRAAKRGVIMLSSGDNFLAGPEFNAGLENGVPFYDTIAMELIGYDAVSLGNHDFDFGPDVLADFLAGFVIPPPYVAANLDFTGEPGLQAYVDAGVIAPATIIKERGEWIGVIGIDTPNLPFISSVDVVIAGGGDELLADGDDLLIPGDEGEVYGAYPQIVADVDGTEVPIVTTSGEYRYVGNLVVGFDKDGEVVVVEEKRSGPVRVATGDCGGTLPCDDAVAPDPMMQAMVVDPVEATVAALAETVIGTSEVALDGLRSWLPLLVCLCPTSPCRTVAASATTRSSPPATSRCSTPSTWCPSPTL